MKYLTVISLTIIFIFSIYIGLILENDNVYGLEYWCDENVLVCNGDETDDEITRMTITI